MGEHREQRAHDRQDLALVLDPDVHVHPEDEHLPTPPLGPVDEGVVPLLVGDLLVGPACERVRAGAHQLHPQRVGHGPQLTDGALDVPRRTGDGLVDAGDDLDCVEQQLLLDHRVLGLALWAQLVQHGRGALAQVTGVGIDEG